MKRVVVLASLTVFVTAAAVCGENMKNIAFKDPVEVVGAAESIVSTVRAAVIIPEDVHESLCIHPNLVTIPSKPGTIELSLRPTDRRGLDQHEGFSYFCTDDFFRTVRRISALSASGWKRIGLTNDDFAPSLDPTLRLPAPPAAEWHWARNCVHINATTILHPFLPMDGTHRSLQTVTARIENGRMVPLYISNVRSNAVGRGLLEPQIAEYGGRFFMTVRAEDGRGYVLVSKDNGQTWDEPSPWRWESGEDIPMHTTMTKLLSHSDGLLLVYTRICDDNTDVFRSRAPLYCADVDPATLSLRKSTERILIPNTGLPMGNFWVCPINQEESYVAATEWPRDGRKQNGDTWLAKIRWKHPNLQMTTDGRETATLR